MAITTLTCSKHASYASGIHSGTGYALLHDHSFMMFVTIWIHVTDGVPRTKTIAKTVRLITNFPVVFISSPIPIIFATSFHFLLRTNYTSTFLLLSDVKSKFRTVTVFENLLKENITHLKQIRISEANLQQNFTHNRP